MFRIARYYYVHDYSQDEIAKLENISRPQISRILKKARESGMVKIAVTLPGTLERTELKEKLRNVLQLKEVLISPSSEYDKANAAGLYSVAADYLAEVLGRQKNVGIGWGKTLYHVSLQLATREEHSDLTFYPLIGNSGTDIPYYQPNNITDRFAEKFRAKALYSHYSVVSPISFVTDIDKKRLDHLKKCWANLDTVVIGIGGEDAVQGDLH
ncbi:MAG TPA: sugar-binding domain-containing protein [Longilinea sp.]|nr:sugar-binding domain-containing protein [Longilinea sp.]